MRGNGTPIQHGADRKMPIILPRGNRLSRSSAASIGILRSARPHHRSKSGDIGDVQGSDCFGAEGEVGDWSLLGWTAMLKGSPIFTINKQRGSLIVVEILAITRAFGMYQFNYGQRSQKLPILT